MLCRDTGRLKLAELIKWYMLNRECGIIFHIIKRFFYLFKPSVDQLNIVVCVDYYDLDLFARNISNTDSISSEFHSMRVLQASDSETWKDLIIDVLNCTVETYSMKFTSWLWFHVKHNYIHIRLWFEAWSSNIGVESKFNILLPFFKTI